MDITLRFEHVVAFYMVIYNKTFVDHSESDKFASFLKHALSGKKNNVTLSLSIKEFEKNNHAFYDNMFVIGSGFVLLKSYNKFGDFENVLGELETKVVKAVLHNPEKTKKAFEEYKINSRHLSL